MTDRDTEVKETREELVGLFSQMMGLLDNLAEGNLTNGMYKGRKTLEV